MNLIIAKDIMNFHEYFTLFQMIFNNDIYTNIFFFSYFISNLKIIKFTGIFVQ